MAGRGKTFILLGVVVLLLAGAGGVYLLIGGGGGQKAPKATPTPAVRIVPIVVSAKEIALGDQIISGTVTLRDWPEPQLPPGAITDVNLAMGQFAQFDIPAGIPILLPMLAAEEAQIKTVSDLPRKIPPGKVAVALPVSRLSSVAYALQPGDHIDVLASFWVLDLDEDFQSKLLNTYYIAVQGEKEVTFMQFPLGGRDRAPIFGFPALEQPTEAQRPRLVAQLTVQNMTVLGVGDWLSQRKTSKQAQGPTPTPVPNQPAPTAAPVVGPDIITVIVDPQDALVLKFMREAGAVIDLALRSEKDAEQTFATESVTLQYMFTRFQVVLPPKLPYGIEPVPTIEPTPVKSK